jgi:hypothetical protein
MEETSGSVRRVEVEAAAGKAEREMDHTFCSSACWSSVCSTIPDVDDEARESLCEKKRKGREREKYSFRATRVGRKAGRRTGR